VSGPARRRGWLAAGAASLVWAACAERVSAIFMHSTPSTSMTRGWVEGKGGNGRARAAVESGEAGRLDHHPVRAPRPCPRSSRGIEVWESVAASRRVGDALGGQSQSGSSVLAASRSEQPSSGSGRGRPGCTAACHPFQPSSVFVSRSFQCVVAAVYVLRPRAHVWVISDHAGLSQKRGSMTRRRDVACLPYERHANMPYAMQRAWHASLPLCRCLEQPDQTQYIHT